MVFVCVFVIWCKESRFLSLVSLVRDPLFALLQNFGAADEMDLELKRVEKNILALPLSVVQCGSSAHCAP